MEFQYDINQIATQCKVSKQSLYTLIKKNYEFINENSTRRQRKIYYNQAVMDFFIAYYQPVAEWHPKDENLPTAEWHPKDEKSLPLTASIGEPPEDQLTALQRKIEALEAEIEALKKDLSSKEEERKELIRQNGALILTLQQEKQEKQLFLPSPKKSFGEKIKDLFRK